MTSQTSNRWLFLAVISFGLLMISADNSILFTALPALRSQLHMSELEGLWVLNAYSLVISGLLLGTGTLGDRIGHRRMFEIGLVLFALASAIAALAPNVGVLIASRALLGVGAAVMMPATLALLRLTFQDVRERNLAIAIWGSVATIGAAAGPVLGGFLLEHFYWGSVFLINIPIALLALFATFIFAPANIKHPTQPWDLLSSMYAMLAMTGLVLLIKEIAHPSSIWLALLLTVIGSVAFWVRGRRQTQPLIAFDIFRNRLFSAGVLTALFAMFTQSGVMLVTTQRFQLTEGFSPLQAGLLTAVAALAAFPTSLIGGIFLHRVGFLPLIGGGLGIMAVGFWVCYLGTSTDTFSVFIIGMLIAGVGAGFAMSVASTAIIGSAPRARSGMASAIEEVSYEFGALISVAVFGTLLAALYTATSGQDASFAQAVDSGAFNHAFEWLLAFAAVCSLLGAALTGWLLRDNPKGTAFDHE
ncbi:MFS transporter [Corynebacterium pelargi]|uniref:Antiseptic resistance protein n=1 Tax=Corynebacterium pelargi TaxID=1471400 RepID=A0A410W717_9CORY|nr:MFS transporter [Corynebacterium pelargi]QAU51676.1 Antiseptic resistance protein [Corynebacterium pelargi]GGG80427.1 MFS transporter [Corynebacterium pelargi]